MFSTDADIQVELEDNFPIIISIFGFSCQTISSLCRRPSSEKISFDIFIFQKWLPGSDVFNLSNFRRKTIMILQNIEYGDKLFSSPCHKIQFQFYWNKSFNGWVFCHIVIYIIGLNITTTKSFTQGVLLIQGVQNISRRK